MQCCFQVQNRFSKSKSQISRIFLGLYRCGYASDFEIDFALHSSKLLQSMFAKRKKIVHGM